MENIVSEVDKKHKHRVIYTSIIGLKREIDKLDGLLDKIMGTEQPDEEQATDRSSPSLSESLNVLFNDEISSAIERLLKINQQLNDLLF